MIDKKLLLCAVVLACSSSLGASTIVPDAIFSVGMTFVPSVGDPVSQSWSAAGNYTLDGITAVASGANAVVGNVFYANSLVKVAAGSGGSVEAQVSYFFTVTGPNVMDGIPLPILVFGHLATTASVTESASSTAQLNVGTALATASKEVQENDVPWSGFLSLNYLPGSQYGGGTVTVGASASGNATALADPFIEVDPTFANASSYQVVVSQGVGNVQPASGAPEPASLGLIGLALAAGGLLRRRSAPKA